jgi:hypothetical protein
MEGSRRGEVSKEWIQVEVTKEGKVQREVRITEEEMREKTKQVGGKDFTVLPLEETLASNQSSDKSSLNTNNRKINN